MPNFDVIAQGPEPIASYQPILQLGRGGMGTVDLARAVGAGGFERLVVVKRLNRELLDQPEAVRRFLDEARQAALVHHANVVGIHQIGKDEKGYFLVLDYVEGASLEGLVDRIALQRETLPAPIVLRIALDALSGLHAAHRAEDAMGKPLGLLHRDVSLQNVLVGRDGVSRIADFGIAKSRLASVQTDVKYLVGKLLYLPPEYLSRKPIGPTLDIYSLGVTLWVTLAGGDPWPDIDEAQLIAQICREGFPRLSEAGVKVAPQVDDLVAKACDKTASKRFQTAREMGDAIERIGRETGWVATSGEVADYVEKLVGDDMKRRRDKVGEFISGLAEAPTYLSNAPPGPPTDARSRKVSATDGVEVPPRANKGPMIVVAAAAVILAVGGIVWLKSSGSEPPPETASGSSAAPVTPRTAAPEEPVAAKAAPEPAAVVPAKPATTQVVDVAPAPEPPRATVKKPAQAKAPASEKPARPVAPVTPNPAGATPPESVIKTNPYR
jgi:serine/threonine-protein kinase